MAERGRSGGAVCATRLHHPIGLLGRQLLLAERRPDDRRLLSTLARPRAALRVDIVERVGPDTLGRSLG